MACDTNFVGRRYVTKVGRAQGGVDCFDQRGQYMYCGQGGIDLDRERMRARARKEQRGRQRDSEGQQDRGTEEARPRKSERQRRSETHHSMRQVDLKLFLVPEASQRHERFDSILDPCELNLCQPVDGVCERLGPCAACRRLDGGRLLVLGAQLHLLFAAPRCWKPAHRLLALVVFHAVHIHFDVASSPHFLFGCVEQGAECRYKSRQRRNTLLVLRTVER